MHSKLYPLFRSFFLSPLQSTYRAGRSALYQVQRLLGILLGRGEILLFGKNISPEELREITIRMRYYLPAFPEQKVRLVTRWPWRALLTLDPLLLFGKLPGYAAPLRKVLHNLFCVDYRFYPQDGWEWVRLANLSDRHRPDVRRARELFIRRVEALRGQKLEKSYIFGTGPSLEKAIDRDWSDGYRIVSNTIAKDPVLWKHLDPHVLVAADAIYHFGHTSFAQAFRRDLMDRLSETPTLFVYPDFFDAIVQRHFSPFKDRLIPIPMGFHQNLHVDLCREFRLPNLGNVLALMLLPLGCTLSKTVCLWGFDGRAPSDQLFWSNSNKHTYQELIPEIQRAHPCFFQHYVPKEDPNKYVRSVHGDLLEERLSAAEKEGYQFRLLHRSWTATLQKRFVRDR
jgi:hypothetical protein